MSKIQRRRNVVTLYHGNYEAELGELMDQAMSALRAEETGATRRAGTKSKAAALAREYDAKAAEAEETATKVTVWAIRYDEWSELADEHPPRDGEANDAKFGLNMKTFPPALLRVSLADPEVDDDVEGKRRVGESFIRDLGPSRVNYTKLETAAWNVNVGDDALPKSSLVSLVKQAREPDSKQPSDSE